MGYIILSALNFDYCPVFALQILIASCAIQFVLLKLKSGASHSCVQASPTSPITTLPCIALPGESIMALLTRPCLRYLTCSVKSSADTCHAVTSPHPKSANENMIAAMVADLPISAATACTVICEAICIALLLTARKAECS